MNINEARTTDKQIFDGALKLGIPLMAVLNKDELKHIIPKSGGYVINLQDSTDGYGTHWLGLWIDNKKKTAVYYDSYGIDEPIAVNEFIKRSKANKTLRNDKQIQSIKSGGCGQYCIEFLHHMKNGKGTYEQKLKSLQLKYIV